MTERPETLPVVPDPQPPGPCVVCGRPVTKTEAYAVLRTPEFPHGVLLCAPCTAETRAHFVTIRERKGPA